MGSARRHRVEDQRVEEQRDEHDDGHSEQHDDESGVGGAGSDERASYGKYDGRTALWFNKYGNLYDSNSLNYILNELIEVSGIKPAGQELSWYGIRHGVAIAWADEENCEGLGPQPTSRICNQSVRFSLMSRIRLSKLSLASSCI